MKAIVINHKCIALSTQALYIANNTYIRKNWFDTRPYRQHPPNFPYCIHFSFNFLFIFISSPDEKPATRPFIESEASSPQSTLRPSKTTKVDASNMKNSHRHTKVSLSSLVVANSRNNSNNKFNVIKMLPRAWRCPFAASHRSTEITSVQEAERSEQTFPRGTYRRLMYTKLHRRCAMRLVDFRLYRASHGSNRSSQICSAPFGQTWLIVFYLWYNDRGRRRYHSFNRRRRLIRGRWRWRQARRWNE